VAQALEKLGFAACPHERGVRGAVRAEDPVEPRDGRLGAVPIADVPRRALDRDERARRIEDRRAAPLEPDPMTVRVLEPQDDRVRHLRRAWRGPQKVAVVRVGQPRQQAGVRVERRRCVPEHGLDRRAHVFESRGRQDAVANDDILGVLGEEPEAVLARLELRRLACPPDLEPAEQEGQDRAGQGNKAPALQDGERDERRGIAHENAEHPIAQRDPEDRADDVPEHDGPGRQLGDGTFPAEHAVDGPSDG
jgi:hypothetical protein